MYREVSIDGLFRRLLNDSEGRKCEDVLYRFRSWTFQTLEHFAYGWDNIM